MLLAVAGWYLLIDTDDLVVHAVGMALPITGGDDGVRFGFRACPGPVGAVRTTVLLCRRLATAWVW